jgi:hypothetical protein
MASNTLEEIWNSAPDGRLSAQDQMKAWALREVLKARGEAVKHAAIARLLRTGGSSSTNRAPPTGQAVGQLFSKMDADANWYPGKSYQTKFGPDAALNGAKRRCIANSAMALSGIGGEPTYKALVSRCPLAVVNPETKKPVTKTIVYRILRGECKDEGAEQKWLYQHRLTRTALPPHICEKRYTWTGVLLEMGLTEAWFCRHVVWVDICNTILPRSEGKAFDQQHARKGKKGWISKDAREWSRNLRGKKESLKQASWDTERLWWVPVLTRGRLHIEVLPESFPGETPEGVQLAIERLPGILKQRFPKKALPKVIFCDRGKGFFRIANGEVTPEFKAALGNTGMRSFWGNNASAQPGTLQDVLLHETAVSWMRYILNQTTPANAHKETRAEYATRLREACRTVNANHNVDGLCRQFLGRVQEVRYRDGDRLSK